MTRLKLGVIGLGRAFSLMRPTFLAHPAVELVAATDLRVEAKQRFESEFGGRTYRSSDDLCDDPDVEAVYVASPHEHHARHARKAIARGKHVLVEKPMAVTLAECDAMIEAADKAGVRLVVGPSHSFDAPIARARGIVESGALGAVRMLTALDFTDFLYRPRRPEELDTARGGGVFFSQAAHQVDIARLLAGDRVTSVRASAGAWDRTRPTEGAYAAHLAFANGAFAALTYSGYAHFDSDELLGSIGELGQEKTAAYGAARRALARVADPQAEADAKAARNYGGESEAAIADPVAHPHFGFWIVSCERGDLRPTPQGVHVYTDDEARFEPLPPPAIPRHEVIDELVAAIASGRPARHDGRWGRETLAACLAMLASSREGREVAL